MSDDTVKLKRVELPESRIFPEVNISEVDVLQHIVPGQGEHVGLVPNFGLLPIVDSATVDIIFEPGVPKTLYQYLLVNCGFGMKRPVMGMPAYRSLLAIVDQVLNQLASTGILHWEVQGENKSDGAWIFEGIV